MIPSVGEPSERSQNTLGADLLEALTACTELVNSGRSRDGEGLRDLAGVAAFGERYGFTGRAAEPADVARPAAPLANRIAAHLGMVLAELIVAGDSGRLRTCAAPSCRNAFLGLSRNRSRRYCDSRTCGNRLHVAAYRARRAGAS
jgi:predicted RNA-binding Zn ribbon-like protein